MSRWRLVGRVLLRVLLPFAVVLGVLWAVDRAIARYEGGGPYRQEIPRPIRAVRKAPEARHIVLGCSTSNWFAGALSRGWQLGKADIVDAHMSDCLQACTMAEARHLAALGRHFKSATFGVNAFEYCEAYRERRSMQEVALMPIGQSLELARVYLHSEDPLRHAGGWLLNHVSNVYGNTMWLQRHVRKQWFGNETLDGRWARRVPAPPRPRRESFQCDYVGADRDFGLAATRGALRAMTALADRVQLVVLPDKQNVADTDAARAARELYAREQRELAAEFERVDVIELLDPKLLDQKLFRDGAHLSREGVKIASRLLAKRLPALPEVARVGGGDAAPRVAPAPSAPAAGEASEPAPALAEDPGEPAPPLLDDTSEAP